MMMHRLQLRTLPILVFTSLIYLHMIEARYLGGGGAVGGMDNNRAGFDDEVYLYESDPLMADGTLRIRFEAPIEMRRNAAPMFYIGTWRPNAGHADGEIYKGCSCSTRSTLPAPGGNTTSSRGNNKRTDFDTQQPGTWANRDLDRLVDANNVSASAFHTFFPKGRKYTIQELQTLWNMDGMADIEETDHPFYRETEFRAVDSFPNDIDVLEAGTDCDGVNDDDDDEGEKCSVKFDVPVNSCTPSDITQTDLPVGIGDLGLVEAVEFFTRKTGDGSSSHKNNGPPAPFRRSAGLSTAGPRKDGPQQKKNSTGPAQSGPTPVGGPDQTPGPSLTEPITNPIANVIRWHLKINIHQLFAYCGHNAERGALTTPNTGSSMNQQRGLVNRTVWGPSVGSQSTRKYKFRIQYLVMGQTHNPVRYSRDITAAVEMVDNTETNLEWASLGSNDACNLQYGASGMFYAWPAIVHVDPQNTDPEDVGKHAKLTVAFSVQYDNVGMAETVGPRMMQTWKPQYMDQDDHDAENNDNRDGQIVWNQFTGSPNGSDTDNADALDPQDPATWDVYVPKSVYDCYGLTVARVYADNSPDGFLPDNVPSMMEPYPSKDQNPNLCRTMPRKQDRGGVWVRRSHCRYVILLETPVWPLRADGKTFSHTCPNRPRPDKQPITLSNVDDVEESDLSKAGNSWGKDFKAYNESAGATNDKIVRARQTLAEDGGLLEGVQEFSLSIRPWVCHRPVSPEKHRQVPRQHKYSHNISYDADARPRNCNRSCATVGPMSDREDTLSISFVKPAWRGTKLTLSYQVGTVALHTNILSSPDGLEATGMSNGSDAQDLRPRGIIGFGNQSGDSLTPYPGSGRVHFSDAQIEYARHALRHAVCDSLGFDKFAVNGQDGNIDVTTELCGRVGGDAGKKELVRAQTDDGTFPPPVANYSYNHVNFQKQDDTHGLCIVAYNKFFTTWDNVGMRQYIRTDSLVFTLGSRDESGPRVTLKRSEHAPGRPGDMQEAKNEDPSSHGVIVTVENMIEVEGGNKTTLNTWTIPGTDENFTWAHVLDQMVAPSREVATNQRADTNRSVLETAFVNATHSVTGWGVRETMPFVNVHGYAGDLSGIDAFCINPPAFRNMLDPFVSPITFQANFYRIDMSTIYMKDMVYEKGRRRLLSMPTTDGDDVYGTSQTDGVSPDETVDGVTGGIQDATTHTAATTNTHSHHRLRRIGQRHLLQDTDESYCGVNCATSRASVVINLLPASGTGEPSSSPGSNVQFDSQSTQLLAMGQHNVHPSYISMGGVSYYPVRTTQCSTSDDYVVWNFVFYLLVSIVAVLLVSSVVMYMWGIVGDNLHASQPDDGKGSEQARLIRTNRVRQNGAK
jgi:hypothetical protein